MGVGAEVVQSGNVSNTESSRFSFGNPDTFRHGSNVQKQTLLGIADAEFRLSQLADDDRKIAETALANSGVEVYDSCDVEMTVAGHLGAFFVRHEQHEQTRFNPDDGVLELPRRGVG